jgi:hypothetical protein
VELLLALVGIAGVALLVQSKPLPSEGDYTKAKAKLDQNPLDPDANTIVGKYMAFVQGDYSNAMPYLVHSPDKTLSNLAAHELDEAYTKSAIQKVAMGDEWVSGAKNFKPLSPIFYDRANQFYGMAWPDLDDLWKNKARQQGRKIAQARPPGQSKKTLPTGWEIGTDVAGSKPPTLDGTVARTGSYSATITAPDEKVKGSFSGLKSAVFLVTPGKLINISAYILSDGTEGIEDGLHINFFDQNGTLMIGSTLGTYVQPDLPFWTRYSFSGKVPDNAARASLFMLRKSKKGEMFLDDASVKIDGKEAIKNPSFEEK